MKAVKVIAMDRPSSKLGATAAAMPGGGGGGGGLNK